MMLSIVCKRGEEVAVEVVVDRLQAANLIHIRVTQAIKPFEYVRTHWPSTMHVFHNESGLLPVKKSRLIAVQRATLSRNLMPDTMPCKDGLKSAGHDSTSQYFVLSK